MERRPSRKSECSCVCEYPVKSVHVNETFDDYDNVRKTVLSGKMKQDLTQWWLELCETRAVAYLVLRGFDVCALPYNYLDKPPTSLNDVKSNVEVLNEVLSQGLEEFREQVVIPVMDMVYSRIEQYEGIVEVICKDEEDNADVGKMVSEALRDVDHIHAMKEAESTVYYVDGDTGMTKLVPSRTKASDTAIVPIGGILVGVLLRLQNEHLTALKHWGNRRI